MEAWERQKGESVQAYDAFVTYRDMGSSRSGAKVGQELGKSKTLVERWSSRWEWVWRCEQYDTAMEQQRLRDRAKELQQAKDRQARMAQAMLQKVLEKLQALTPDDISPGVMVQMVKVASDLERHALGEVDTVAITGAGGGPVQNDIRLVLDALDDPEARDALDALSQRLESQPSGDGG